MLPLGEIISVSSGCGLNVRNLSFGEQYPVYGGNGIVGTTNKYLVDENTLIIGRVGANCGCVHRTKEKSFVTDNALIVTIKTSYISVDYLFYVLKSINYKSLISSTAQPLISGRLIYPLLVYISSLPNQHKICVKLEKILNCI